MNARQLTAFVGATILSNGITGCSQSDANVVMTAPLVSGPLKQISESFARGNLAGAPLVYVSDGERNAVFGFTPAGEKVLKISGLHSPWGMFVDSDRNLWVAENGAGDVLVFPKGQTRPIKTLSYPGMAPDDVAVCPNGTVYVSSTAALEDVGIAVYADGSSVPTGSLNDPQAWAYYNIACDAANNVFVNLAIEQSWMDYPQLVGVVDEFPQGTQALLRRLPISNTGLGLRPFGSNLLISFGSSVAEYTEAGAPTGYSAQIGSDSLGIAVSSKDRKVLAAEGQARVAISWAFPGREPGHIYRAPDLWYPLGVAYDPGEQFR